MHRTAPVALLLGATALGQGTNPMSDPKLDPHYQPPADPAGSPVPGSAAPPPPAVTPQTGAPAGVHPATVGSPVNPGDPLVAPPPGWQLARPVVLDGNLYYAVDDADAYIAQAGWAYAPVVHRKGDTGFRFDLILVPQSNQDSSVYRSTVHSGTRISLRSGGVSTTWGPGWHWQWGDDWVFNTNGYAGPIDGQLSPGYAPPIPQPEPVVLTTIEQAGLALGFGDPEESISLYRMALEADPDDTRAVRALGVALLAAGRPEDAAATIRYAYATDPGLAGEPLGAWIGGDSPRRLRTLITDMVKHANKQESASAWLSVAVLMQAEGRDRVALGILDRAAALGLDEDVVRALRAEMMKR